jgi:hypothetical protein
MKPRRLNLTSAMAALAGSLLWLALGQLFAGAVWFAASLVLVWMALKRYRDPILPLVTPGEILREEFLAPLGLSANQLAKALRVPPIALPPF